MNKIVRKLLIILTLYFTTVSSYNRGLRLTSHSSIKMLNSENVEPKTLSESKKITIRSIATVGYLATTLSLLKTGKASATSSESLLISDSSDGKIVVLGTISAFK